MRPPDFFRRNLPLIIIVSAVVIDLLFIAAAHYLRRVDIIHLLQFARKPTPVISNPL